MTNPTLRRLALLGYLALQAGGLCAATTETQVHTLHFQTGDSLLPAVQASLQPGESATAYHNDLIINAAPARQTAIGQLIDQLDRPLRNLLIEVRRDGLNTDDNNDTAFSGGIQQGTVYLGTHGQMYEGGHEIRNSRNGGIAMGDRQAQIRSQHEIHSTVQQQSQQIRVLEGSPAMISRGESRPVRQYDRYGNAVTSYQEAATGIFVTAHVNEDQVVLDISAGNDRFANDAANSIDTEQLQTRISGQLGEWIELGDIVSRLDSRSHSLSSRQGDDQSGNVRIAVRITALDR